MAPLAEHPLASLLPLLPSWAAVAAAVQQKQQVLLLHLPYPRHLRSQRQGWLYPPQGCPLSAPQRPFRPYSCQQRQ